MRKDTVRYVLVREDLEELGNYLKSEGFTFDMRFQAGGCVPILEDDKSQGHITAPSRTAAIKQMSEREGLKTDYMFFIEGDSRLEEVTQRYYEKNSCREKHPRIDRPQPF